VSRGAGAKKSASPRQQSTRDFIKSALGSTEREPGWEYGQILPVRARKNEEGGMEREWGLGYSNTAKGMLDAFTLPRRAMEGEEVTPEQAMEMAMNVTAPGVATARYAPGVLNMPTVYHGTPHRFEPTPDNPLGEFRAAQIGTGEGAQMYGHGIYLAENPAVAKEYARTLSADREQAIRRALAGFDMEVRDLEMLKKIKLGEAPWPNNQRGQPVSPEFIDKQIAERSDSVNVLQSLKEKLDGLNSVYTADLPDEMVDRMLDWDKPLTEQSLDVQRKIQQLVDKELGKGTWSVWSKNNPDYRDLRDSLFENKTEPEISELFRQAGIPGIKYLDAGSRDKGKGTRNFVVFPGEEKKAKILKRD
jgi:hypothetical protein